ncbi:MAG: hypothetical protein L6Q84_13085 [Polyangiaceae bacterium]|nr:hypothetical protein [Polyangiaceae bacterium]
MFIRELSWKLVGVAASVAGALFVATTGACGPMNPPPNQAGQYGTPGSSGDPPAAPAAVSGSVSINGKTLSAAELQNLSATIGGTPAAGDYWYDGVAGLYGLAGHGTGGVIKAGLAFPPVARDASRGTAGILVNGRELTGSEAAYLIRVLGGNPQTPEQYRGSYSLDASGNLVRSDGRAMGNIVQASRAAAGPSNNWSSGNASGGGNSSCNWVSFKNESGSTYSSVTSGCD